MFMGLLWVGPLRLASHPLNLCSNLQEQRDGRVLQQRRERKERRAKERSEAKAKAKAERVAETKTRLRQWIHDRGANSEGRFDFRKPFDDFDVSGDGFVDRKEFARVLSIIFATSDL